jgi:hypothetical protein
LARHATPRELGEEDRAEVKEKVMEEVGKWLEHFHCIVIGLELGRDYLLLVHSSLSPL